MTIDSNADEQNRAAAERVRQREGARDEKIRILAEPGGLARADSPERIARRMDRLARYHCGDELPMTAEDVGPVGEPAALMSQAAHRVADSPAVPAVSKDEGDRPDVVLERIINNADFLEFRYLDAGTVAGRAVGRIVLRDARGRLAGYGTGSLVSPRLLLTNHHVLPDAATAASSRVEFNYQDDVDRKPLPEQQFEFDPATFFVADKERDFAIVAVKATAQELAQFGHNPLIRAEGKAIVGERMTVVQHPAGEKKQLVLRDQQIVDIPDSPFLYYLADTARGSSGSPVFNDQWEVVALHHASVPRPSAAPADRPGYVNEGVRVSRILKFVDELALPDKQRALLDEVVVRPPTPAVPPAETAPATKEPPMSEPVHAAISSIDTAAPAADADGWVQITVPLEIRMRLGAPAPAAGQIVVTAPAAPAVASAPAMLDIPDAEQESVVIDPDFAGREGFDTKFLGEGHEVPLPTLSPALQPLASVDTTATSEPKHVLHYHHYSVVMNRERRLAFWVGVNIDGAQHRREELRRSRDKWFFDPRIPREEQIGEDLYSKNKLDRGHLVRRLDPAWGEDFDTAKKANDDTFHFTNCTPQHEDFNQSKTTWAGLEDYVLNNADKANFKASVFTGPVFADDDELYRGVKLPRQFWKVAVMVKRDGTLSATGYLLSQEDLIKGLESDEDFSYAAYKTFQVKIKRIEQLTGLSFGNLADADPLERIESTEDVRELATLDNLIL